MELRYLHSHRPVERCGNWYPILSYVTIHSIQFIGIGMPGKGCKASVGNVKEDTTNTTTDTDSIDVMLPSLCVCCFQPLYCFDEAIGKVQCNSKHR